MRRLPRLAYSAALSLVGLCALPRLAYTALRTGKYRESFPYRVGWRLPDPLHTTGPVLWLHAVSVGETRAALPFARTWLAQNPNGQLVVSNVTETGHAEALRSLPEAARHCYLPFDFAWIVRRVVQRIRPDQVVLCEGDFWPNFLWEAKSLGADLTVINGKVSERSARRMAAFPYAADFLCGSVDTFCVQSDQMKERFLRIGVAEEDLHVTGNL
ncbi:MAG: 3-deoxy-D-manno-octulosonic acid transferase, partial [Chlamydiia bacterium]|nr:3-deoxy-D-manno-octulosonic acid transferase [Chlamydiia bacterium]